MLVLDWQGKKNIKTNKKCSRVAEQLRTTLFETAAAATREKE